MNNYCISFTIYKFISNTGRVQNKIDYFIIPVERIGNTTDFKSMVGSSVFSGLKLKNFNKSKNYLRFEKHRDRVVFYIVVFSDLDMEDSEKYFIPKITKYINLRIPFRFAFKKALKNRAERILLTN